MPNKAISNTGTIPLGGATKIVPLTSKTVPVTKDGKQKISDPNGMILCNTSNKISLQEMINAINKNTVNINDFEIRISQNEADIAINVKDIAGNESRITANEKDISVLYAALGGPVDGLKWLVDQVEENKQDIDLLTLEDEKLHARIDSIDLGDETNTQRLDKLEPIVEKNTDDIEILNQKFIDGTIVGDATATHAGVVRASLTQNVNGLWVLSMTNDGTFA